MAGQDASKQMRRTTLVFSGLVQGVGFRYTTRRVAQRYAVTGYVRNQRGGVVELVAEGKNDELARFTQAVKQAMAGNIHKTESVESPATGEYASFDIVF